MGMPINDFDFAKFTKLANAVKVFKDKKSTCGDNSSSEISLYSSRSGSEGLSWVSLSIQGYVPNEEVERIVNSVTLEINGGSK